MGAIMALRRFRSLLSFVEIFLVLGKTMSATVRSITSRLLTIERPAFGEDKNVLGAVTFIKERLGAPVMCAIVTLQLSLRRRLPFVNSLLVISKTTSAPVRRIAAIFVATDATAVVLEEDVVFLSMTARKRDLTPFARAIVAPALRELGYTPSGHAGGMRDEANGVRWDRVCAGREGRASAIIYLRGNYGGFDSSGS